MKIPVAALYAILTLNLLMFTLLFQLDFLEFHSDIGKAVAWALTTAAAYRTWQKRDAFILLR
jgi:hypothetical protein